jgi:hypothetical protein
LRRPFRPARQTNFRKLRKRARDPLGTGRAPAKPAGREHGAARPRGHRSSEVHARRWMRRRRAPPPLRRPTAVALRLVAGPTLALAGRRSVVLRAGALSAVPAAVAAVGRRARRRPRRGRQPNADRAGSQQRRRSLAVAKHDQPTSVWCFGVLLVSIDVRLPTDILLEAGIDDRGRPTRREEGQDPSLHGSCRSGSTSSRGTGASRAGRGWSPFASRLSRRRMAPTRASTTSWSIRGCAIDHPPGVPCRASVPPASADVI